MLAGDPAVRAPEEQRPPAARRTSDARRRPATPAVAVRVGSSVPKCRGEAYSRSAGRPLSRVSSDVGAILSRHAPPSARIAGPRTWSLSPGQSRSATTGRRGSAEVRAADRRRLPGVQRRTPVGGLPHLRRQDAGPGNDTTIGLTVAGALTPAGLGGCVIELMERGLIDFMISTGANLYHDLHYALNFSLHRGSPFLDDVELYEQGIIRIYDVLFPATVLLETDAYIRDFLVRSKLCGPDVDLGVPLPARPRSARRATRAAPSTRSSPRRRSAACRSTPRRPATARSA